MRSTFYGLEIARKGLFVSQKALDITGHNIANVNTPGYTRQRLVTSSIEPATNMGMLGGGMKGQVGGGVQVQSIDQIRNQFLDMQYRREAKHLGEWTAKTNAYHYIEDIFREPSDASINAALADLFSSISEMAKNPESREIRTLVRQDAIKLTETMHHYHDQLIQLQREQNTAIDIGVKEINDIARNIRNLNEQIYKYELAGESANDLRDRRNLLVDKLSEIVNIDYYETPNGHFRIDIQGVSLVNHVHINQMEVKADYKNPVGEEDFYTVYWKGTDMAVGITGGKLKGYLDIRDGQTADRIGIPYMVEQMNILARALVENFNNVHRAGHPLPNDSDAYATYLADGGIDFFHVPEDGIITARNIRLSDAILDSVFNIAAASAFVNPEDPSTWGNNENALALGALRNMSNLKVTVNGVERDFGNFESYMKEIIAGLAVESSHSYKMMEGQVIMTQSLDNQRRSVSGVSLDEEMTHMIMYQHAYAAASRMITAMDEALDILINRTGLVGR